MFYNLGAWLSTRRHIHDLHDESSSPNILLDKIFQVADDL